MADLPDRIMVTWTKGGRASVTTPASAGMVRAAQGEYVRALPAVTPAPTLAEAARVLADLLSDADDLHPQLEQAVMIASVMEDAEQVEELTAALRRIAEGGR